MSYFRLYPTRNNTIFRYLDQVTGTFPLDPTTISNTNNTKWSVYTNNGANPIMELHDGRSESKLLFGFELPSWLSSRLSSNSFTCSLRLYDAGTLFAPALGPKNLRLDTFNQSFAEGDGYSFLIPKSISGVSNFLYRDSVNSWQDTTFTQIGIQSTDSINQDLSFNLSTDVQTKVTGNISELNYSLSIDNRTANTSILTKFIYSQYTRTVFKPYIEFFINDVINDCTNKFYSDSTNQLYLLNQTGQDFIGTVECTYTFLDYTGSQTVIHSAPGVYYVNITTPSLTTNKTQIATALWTVNGVALYKQLVQVLNYNQVDERIDIRNLHFYPSSSYSHNIVRQGDIIPFIIISEIRGKGNVFADGYEYRVISSDGFEMIPWSQASVYRDKIYFNLNTLFLYPEIEYEVFIRISNLNGTITSPLTYKFKLLDNSQSRLRDLNASPYFNREYFLQK